MAVHRLLAGVALLAVSCLMRGEPVSGEDTGRNWLLSQWHRRVWQIEDGLPHNYVTATLLDSNRYLLIGTQTGIARFDGTRFTPFSKVGDLWIYSLLRTSDGSLWIGSYLNGLRQIKGDRITSWGPSTGPEYGNTSTRCWMTTREASGLQQQTAWSIYLVTGRSCSFRAETPTVMAGSRLRRTTLPQSGLRLLKDSFAIVRAAPRRSPPRT